MEFTTFVRKPFVVEAIEITEENIAEVAELIGTLKQKENGAPYIAVNRRLVPNLFRVYPGFWMTKMGDGDNIRCYSKRVFQQQFVESDVSIMNWVAYLNKDGETVASESETRTEALVEELTGTHEFVEVTEPAVTADVEDPEDAYVEG